MSKLKMSAVESADIVRNSNPTLKFRLKSISAQRPIKRTLTKPLAKINIMQLHIGLFIIVLKYWVIGLYIPPLRLSDYLSWSRLLLRSVEGARWSSGD